MRFIRVGLVAGVAAAVGFGASAAFGSAVSDADDDAVVARPSAGVTAAATSTPTELKYVGVPPCTLVDTRKAAGPLGNGTARDYHARGAGSLASQGGPSTGCGVPENATVIVVNVGSLSPVNAGYVKAKAFGTPGGGAGAVNYAARQNIGGVLNLNLSAPGTAKAFTLINTGGPTGVVVTVTGYFIAPIAVRVAADGSLLTPSSRIVSSSRPATGSYRFTMDRDISGCAMVATPLTASNTTLQAQGVGGAPTQVSVFAYTASNGAARDATFSLVVTC